MHALVRYLERVKGMDLETVRRELGRRVDAALEHHEGASAVLIDGMRFCLRDEDKLVTVLDQNRPKSGRKPRRIVSGDEP